MAATTYNAERVPSTYTVASARRAAVAMSTGDQAPNIKLALMFACVSGAQKLEQQNSNMADLLRPYAKRPLPGRDVVIGWLRQCRANWNGRTLQALYTIDSLYHAGALARFEAMPDTWEDWQSWRSAIKSLIPGIGYKMASFAVYLMWPLDCLLICCDRHHLRRVGRDPERVPQSLPAYRVVEDEILADYFDYCDDLVAPAVFAHYLWSLERKSIGAEPADDLAADHTRLSVRDY